MYNLALNDYVEIYGFGGTAITLPATNLQYGAEVTFQLIAPN